MTDTDRREPQIYVACLASYNEGTLHGRWIDAAQETGELRAEIDDMLSASPAPDAEEWAIHDSEDFGPASVHEFEDLEDVAASAPLIASRGPAAAHLLAHLGGVDYHPEAKRMLEEEYAGAWDSLEAWADSLVDEGLFGEVGERLRPYIDLERLARDMELSGDILALEEGGGVHVFWNH